MLRFYHETCTNNKEIKLTKDDYTKYVIPYLVNDILIFCFDGEFKLAEEYFDYLQIKSGEIPELLIKGIAYLIYFNQTDLCEKIISCYEITKAKEIISFIDVLSSFDIVDKVPNSLKIKFKNLRSNLCVWFWNHNKKIIPSWLFEPPFEHYLNKDEFIDLLDKNVPEMLAQCNVELTVTNVFITMKYLYGRGYSMFTDFSRYTFKINNMFEWLENKLKKRGK